MKYISRHIILIFGWFLLCAPTFAAEFKGLNEIYNTPIPAEIRRNFDEYIHIRKNCPECEQIVVDGEKFIDIYGKKFFVIGLEPNSFGGVWAMIAVEGDTRNAFRLWLYNIEDGVYDLRSVEKVSGRFDQELIEDLRAPAYSKCWL